MKEIITIQVGQCGNQVGWKFWDVVYGEHGREAAGTESGSAFFREAEALRDGGRGGSGPRARAVLVDMEEGVVSQILRSPLSGLFDASHAITDVSGAGNNWAAG
jgi:tubulin epsilon